MRLLGDREHICTFRVNMSELPCPNCGETKSVVIDSRATNFNEVPTIRRRRRCVGCQHRWTTYELSEFCTQQWAELGAELADANRRLMKIKLLASSGPEAPYPEPANTGGE